MTVNNRLIITNNELVKTIFKHSDISFHQICWVNGKTEDVLTIVRDYCHRSYRLITHPLTGSIKPNQTPFKTVILEPIKECQCDTDSIIIAESCLNKAIDMLRFKPRPIFNEAVLNDFATIDLAFFQSYLEACNL